MDKSTFYSRKDPRIKIRIDISIYRNDERPPVILETVDLSRTGICVEGDEVLPVNTPVVVNFFLPDEQEPVEATGVVSWSDPSGKTSGKSGMGIQLFDLSRESERALEVFFDSQNYYGWFF